MDVGEGVNVSIILDDKQKEKKKEKKKNEVDIRYHIFFDGTLNNKVNTKQRKTSQDKNKKEHVRKAAEDVYAKFKGVASYENDYTNVVKLEKYVVKEIKEKKVVLVSYIEGPGSENNIRDDKIGYGLGLGDTGVREKVKKGVNKVISEIKENVKVKNSIKSITFDVFGFSRGAACARNFIYEALVGDELKSIKKQLIKTGYDVDEVKVCFAGLYDTVSSHGLFYFNDVCDLKLDAIRKADNVVHLASADEHRENFSLTNIKSAGHKGIEIFLPGVHSDIGGSYNDAKQEKKIIYDSWLSSAETDKERLVKSGWFDDDQVILDIYDDDLDEYDKYAISKVDRKSVSNQYSKIPLQIMARFSRESDIIVKKKLEKHEEVQGETLVDIKKRIDNYIDNRFPVGKDGKRCSKNIKSIPSKMEDWHSNDDVLLKTLRNRYLHFSAEWKFGLKPRMSFWRGIRYRKVYNG